MFLTTRNADFVNLGSRINRMLNDTLGSLDWQVRDSAAAAWMPPVDVLEERTERVHRYERTYGAFERSFTLPATVDANNIKASYEHGVLTVTLPKVEKAKPRQIPVQAASK